MRLIDADALKEYILRSVPNWSEGREIVLDCIANSPTIEERKKGEWIIQDNPGTGWYRVVCSECGEDVTSNIPMIGFFPDCKPLWGYCPECGSYNGGGGE